MWRGWWPGRLAPPGSEGAGCPTERAIAMAWLVAASEGRLEPYWEGGLVERAAGGPRRGGERTARHSPALPRDVPPTRTPAPTRSRPNELLAVHPCTARPFPPPGLTPPSPGNAFFSLDALSLSLSKKTHRATAATRPLVGRRVGGLVPVVAQARIRVENAAPAGGQGGVGLFDGGHFCFWFQKKGHGMRKEQVLATLLTLSLRPSSLTLARPRTLGKTTSVTDR